MDELPGTTRGDKRATGMFKSAFNNAFRAGLHALAYQHVTALVSPDACDLLRSFLYVFLLALPSRFMAGKESSTRA